MNVHISYKAGKTPNVEREFKHQLEKLERRLQVFKPELVHLHAIVELENGHSARATLNLRLPSGQLAAQKSGDTTQTAIKGSFSELLHQVGKHKELLRGNWSWSRRKTPGKERAAADVSFRQLPPTPPKVEPEPAATELNSGNIGHWIHANLPRLERFVDRELRYRCASGQVPESQISREEVIDEVIVSVLSHEEHPDEFPLESRLYRLALRAIQRVAQANADTAAVSLEDPAGVQNVTGSDENHLQYHQPDDSLSEESVIRDDNVRTPEEIFAGEEMVAQLDLVLHRVRAQEREAFVLYALEGFTVDEIARITDLSADRIRGFIEHAREQVKRHLPSDNELRWKLLRDSHGA